MWLESKYRNISEKPVDNESWSSSLGECRKPLIQINHSNHKDHMSVKGWQFDQHKQHGSTKTATCYHTEDIVNQNYSHLKMITQNMKSRIRTNRLRWQCMNMPTAYRLLIKVGVRSNNHHRVICSVESLKWAMSCQPTKSMTIKALSCCGRPPRVSQYDNRPTMSQEGRKDQIC